MVSTVMLLAVLSAPRAPAEASLVSWVPRVDGVAPLVPFFRAAGTRSNVLRPEAWAADAHALIGLDLLDAEALERSGIDGTQGLTRSQLGDAVISCVTVKDLKRYRAACDEKLVRQGELIDRKEAGLVFHTSQDPLGRVLGAYVVSGKESCAINGHGHSIDKQLAPLAKLLSAPATGPGFSLAAKLPAPLQLVAPGGRTPGVLALNANGLSLQADLRVKNAALARLVGAGESPLGRFTANGLGIIRARVAPLEVPALTLQLTRELPGATALVPVAKALAPLLTGNAAVLLSHAKVSGGLRSKEARFFALRFALVAEVSDAAAAKAVVSGLDARSLSFAQGTLTVGVSDRFVVVANDDEVRQRAIAALPTAAGKQAHGVEFSFDPKLVARALQQVPLWEAVQSAELAGFVAASAELGPLLLASSHITGWLDSLAGATHAGRLTWELDPEAFTAPPATPATP